MSVVKVVAEAARRLRVRLAARVAYQRLRACGGDGVLVGTAALQFLGYDVEAPDVDFLCRDDVVPGAVSGDWGYRSSAYRILGLPVNYVGELDEGRRRFYHPEEATVVHGVPVADLRHVIGLKRWAARPKDIAFFAHWDARRWADWREP